MRAHRVAALLCLAICAQATTAHADPAPPRPRNAVRLAASAAGGIGLATAWTTGQIAVAVATSYLLTSAGINIPRPADDGSYLPPLYVVIAGSPAMVAGAGAGVFASARAADPLHRGSPLATAFGSGIGTAFGLGAVLITQVDLNRVENGWLIPAIAGAATLGAMIGYETTLAEVRRPPRRAPPPPEPPPVDFMVPTATPVFIDGELGWMIGVTGTF